MLLPDRLICALDQQIWLRRSKCAMRALVHKHKSNVLLMDLLGVNGVTMATMRMGMANTAVRRQRVVATDMLGRVMALWRDLFSASG